ncbi:STAS domain protein [Leptospira interrogans serovar Pomona str. CSL4002]|nr:STAS domain protein [Leptospira interrogans serovar Pomona str. CSL4002]
MEIKTKKIGKHTLVALNGRLDIGHSDEVEAKLLDDVQSGQGDILINLENISYISSSGDSYLCRYGKRIGKAGKEIKALLYHSACKKSI